MPHNTMEDNEVDKMVLTYDDYIKFKEKFDPKNPISLEDVKLNDILDIAQITGTSRTNYYNAFNTLLKHIHRDGLFIDRDNPEACKYINYILYKEVEVEHDIKRSYDDELISLFHKFLVAYGIKRGKQNRCISNIYSIKPQTYNIINALYDVYDKHNKCIIFTDNNVRHVCDKFEDFFHSYDKYTRDTQSKSVEFNEILQNIEKQANVALTKYKIGCNDYNKKPQSPRLFEPPRAQIPEIHNPVQKVQTHSQPVESTSHYATHEITHTQQAQLPNGIYIPQPIQENQETGEGHGENEDDNEIVSHQDNSHQETIDSSIRSNVEQSKSYSRYETPIRPSYFSGTLYSGRPGRVGEQEISNEVEMSPLSVMSTISSALKDVDPVPVVGVSGGMGVLFLLFRYTPVGTFFRGRGYRQRIPTRFDGVYPGFHPGFEGFEEGYFLNNQINIAYGPE